MLREIAFRTIRAVGLVLPVPALIAVLYPLAVARALFDSIRRRHLTPIALPPGKRRASFTVELGQRTSAWLSTFALLWADHFARSPWTRRIDVHELDALRDVSATRPVIIATLHFGGIFVMPALLRAYGIPTAAVVGDKLWPVRWWRERRAQLTRIGDLPAHLRSGDARAMARYLQPGHCLLVALDYPLGDQLLSPYEGGALRLSTPSFRLARVTGAAVVPLLVRVDGAWRFSIHVGAPVPHDVLAREDDAAALAHVVNDLLPIAATAPQQALPLLVNAFQRTPETADA